MTQRIHRQQAESMLSANISQPVSAFLAALGFWASFYYQMPQPGILVWAALIHSAQVQRLLAARAYLRTPPQARDSLAAVERLCIALAVSGAVWGLAPWLFFPKGNMPLTSLMMLILLCLSSMSMVALSTYRKAVIWFNLPIFAGLISALFWQGDWQHAVLGLGTCIYLAGNLQFGLYLNRLLTESLRAKFENQDLARDLAEQVKIVERASAEKTRFLASASHDLRQPLHSLGLFGSAITARLKGTADEAMARNLMHCVDALEASFSSMLDISKLDAGVVAAHAQPVALAEVFRKLQNTFERQAEAQGLALRFKPAGKWVMADAALLERLLGNLVHNALKFTRQGGVALVARRSDLLGEQVRVEVWDTGVGMESTELAHIFDEFYQVGNQERDRAKGLGMGLAIVQRLALLLDAPVQVASRPGRGSVFKLVLPTAEPDLAAAPVAHGHALTSGMLGALHGATVLVVDDEASVRDGTAAALRLCGLQVETADGLAQALAAADRLNQLLDAVISDYRLRDGKNGDEVVAQLRLRLGRKLPALLITGDTAPERVRQAQESGLAVLYKPVKASLVVEALREQLGPR